MSTKTLGTAATTTLTAVQIPPTGNATPAISDTDWATMANSILDDVIISHPIYPGAMSRSGLLYLPNRGIVRLLPGDWIAVDTGGYPYLIPNYALAQTLTATLTMASGNPAATATSSVITLGWQVGMGISGTNITSGSAIKAISADGKTVTFTKNANGTGAQTATVSNGWTHS